MYRAAIKVVMTSSLAISHGNVEQISDVLETFKLYHQGFIISYHVYITDGPRRFHCTHCESIRCSVKVMLTRLVHKLAQEFLLSTQNTHSDGDLSVAETQ
jgi:NADH:ubiquinone oxidoreductase subunit E